jgi:hypothetical protein
MIGKTMEKNYKMMKKKRRENLTLPINRQREKNRRNMLAKASSRRSRLQLQQPARRRAALVRTRSRVAPPLRSSIIDWTSRNRMSCMI